MSFYVASLFSRMPEAAGLAAELRGLGCEITSTWHDGGEKEDRAEAAEQDAIEVLLADATVVLAQPNGSLFKGGGHCTEFGIALGAGKRLFVVGDRSNVFYHHPAATHFLDRRAFFDYIRGINLVRGA